MTIQPTPVPGPRFESPQRPAPAAEGPDLVVTGLRPDRVEPRMGDPIHFQVEVFNRGSADAGAFDVRLQGDEVKQQVSLAGLPAGEKAVVRMGPRVADGKQLYTVRVDVDPADRVPEIDEGNNYLIAFLPGVRPPQPPPQPPPLPPLPPGRP